MRRVVHLLGGMLLGALLATSPQRIRAIAPQDPVATSPQYYKVLIDNDQVRVLEYRLKPGEKEAMHSHPAGVVRYLADATFRTTTSVGKESESSVHIGQTIWRDATTHASVNVGTTEAIAFAIELKKTCS